MSQVLKKNIIKRGPSCNPCICQTRIHSWKKTCLQKCPESGLYRPKCCFFLHLPCIIYVLPIAVSVARTMLQSAHPANISPIQWFPFNMFQENTQETKEDLKPLVFGLGALSLLLLALVLLLSPGPQVTEHSAQGLQVSGPHSRGQAASSHFLTSVPFPAHWPPSIRGSRRIFLVRDWLPTPQVTEQSDQSENPDQRQSLPAKINCQKIIGAERFPQD